jgi:hypothetical protein
MSSPFRAYTERGRWFEFCGNPGYFLLGPLYQAGR